MTSNWHDTIGIDPAAMVEILINKGITKYDAARLINNLIAVNLGQAPRHFTFSSPLPKSESGCAPTFDRTFTHQDWIDGESVVQAGESADDKGFNWRFNALAADIDALHADTARLLNCLSALRQALVGALQDVAAELNRLNGDVAALATKVPPETPWHLSIADSPQFLGVRKFDDDKVTVWKTGNSVVVLPGIHTIELQETVSQRLATGGLVSRYASEKPEFVRDLGAGVVIKELIKKYGDDPLGDGRTVAQALAVLPLEAKYATTQAVVDAVNTQEQAFLRSTVGSVDAVSAVLGVTSEGVPLAKVSPSGIAKEIGGATGDLGTAITKAGLLTVEEVAGLSAKQLVLRLGEQGVRITGAQADELRSRALMIAGLGR